ncbi:MAG: hypothetical protein IJZ29_03640 [Clostridia bacterium]|nr:hypothetical protein [Clostridia bacterium]
MKLRNFKRKKVNNNSVNIIDFNTLTETKAKKIMNSIGNFTKLSMNIISSSSTYKFISTNYNDIKNEFNALLSGLKYSTNVALDNYSRIYHSKLNNFKFDINLINDAIKEKNNNNLKLYYKRTFDYNLNSSKYFSDDFMQAIYKEDISQLLKNSAEYDALINGK